MEEVAGPEGIIAQVAQPEAGATGDKLAKTGKADANVGVLVALSPEAVEGPPPPAPSVTNLSPSTGSAAGGTPVTITGTNLAGASAVKFGSTNATAFTVNSATSITATSPPGSGTVEVTVTTRGGISPASAADRFSYLAASAKITLDGKSATNYGFRENCKVRRPAGAVLGDQMLMQAYVEDPDGRGPFTIASNGWQLLEKIENKSHGIWFTLAVFAKRYEAGDPSEYTVSWSGTTRRGCGGLAAAWSGVSKSEPINAHLGAPSAGGTTTVRAPSIVTSKPNSEVVMLADYNAPDTRTLPRAWKKWRVRKASSPRSLSPKPARPATSSRKRARPTPTSECSWRFRRKPWKDRRRADPCAQLGLGSLGRASPAGGATKRL